MRGQFDRELGTMVRDPKNADKTATEILVAHRQGIEERLLDDDYEVTKVLGVVTAAAVIVAIAAGVLLWPGR